MKNDVVKLRNISFINIKYNLVYSQVVLYVYLTLEISKFPNKKREKFKKEEIQQSFYN